MARIYQCPKCGEGTLRKCRRKRWPKVDLTMRGYLQCNRCRRVVELPAPTWMCAATALLGVGLTVLAVVIEIYPSIGRLISGEMSYRVLTDPIKGLAVIFLSGSLVHLAWRTRRYSREFVKAQPDSTGKHRDT